MRTSVFYPLLICIFALVACKKTTNTLPGTDASVADGSVADAHVNDASPVDAATDMNIIHADASESDAALTDASESDATTVDAATHDASETDATVADAATHDASGDDGGPADRCTNTGGTVTTVMCCAGAMDFPNSCLGLIGGCSCFHPPRATMQCECPRGYCFDPATGCTPFGP